MSVLIYSVPLDPTTPGVIAAESEIFPPIIEAEQEVVYAGP